MEKTSLLQKYKVKDVLSIMPLKRIISVDEKATVKKVLKDFAAHNVSFAIVHSTDGRPIGFITTLDIVIFCSSKLSSTAYSGSEKFLQLEEFSEQNAKDIINLSQRNSWTPANEETSLLELNEIFTKKTNQVPVLDAEKKCTSIISKFDVVTFLYKCRTSDFLSSKKVEHFVPLGGKVDTVFMNDSVLEAMKIIWQKNRSGLAVVSGNGILVGNISAS